MIYVIAILGVLAAIAGAAVEGAHWQEVKDIKAIDAAKAERVAAVAEFVVDMSARNTKQAEELRALQSGIGLNTATLIKEVTKYVTAKADAACVVPVGFVQHFNASWGMPGVSRTTDVKLVDRPSGVPLSVVGSANADNAGQCLSYTAEALSWRSWYKDRQARWNAFAGATKSKP